MAAEKRTASNLGRLLEATRGDAPLLAWSLVVGVLAGGVGGAFRLVISRSQDLVSAGRALGGSDGALPLLISIASSALPASR